MITSSAPSHIMDQVRRLAGPNPEGSKLTDTERLHLIYLLGAVDTGDEQAVVRIIRQLEGRGVTPDDLGGILIRQLETGPNAVSVADMIAVHPNLRSIADSYLD